MKEKPIFATVGIMMMAAFTGKVMGLLRDRMLGVTYGTDTVEGIAFMQASVLPRLFLDIMFVAVVSACFVPVFNEYLETKGKKAAFELAARFVTIIGLITLVLTALFIVFSPLVYAVFLSSDYADPAIRVLGIRLLRILFPLMILSGLAFSLASMLQSLGNFNVPAVMSIASNGIILIYYFFFIDYFGVYGLAAAFLLGWTAQILIQVPFLVKHRFRLSLKNFTWRDEGLRKIAKLALPVMVATWVAPVNLLVNGAASVNLYGGEHGYSAINLAYSLYTIITGLFVLSLAHVLLPKLSRLAAAGNLSDYAAFMRSSLRSLFFMLLPMTFGLMAVAHPLVRLVFQGGRFQYESVSITATALFYFSLGILGFGLQIILCRAFYAMQNGRAPLITGIIAMVINLILSFTLAPAMEIGGPALASAVSISTAAILLFIMLRRMLPSQSLWTFGMTKDAAKMLALSVLVFFAARQSLYVLEDLFAENTLISRFVTVLVPVALGAGLYIGGCLLLRVPEARGLVRFVFEKIMRKMS